MRVIKTLIVIATISILTTGCAEHQFVVPQVSSLPPTPVQHDLSIAAPDISDSPMKRFQAYSTEDNQEYIEEEPTTAYPALELCHDAQILWLDGETDKAIDKLDAAYKIMLTMNESVSIRSMQQKDKIRLLISKRINEIYSYKQNNIDRNCSAIPMRLNKHVEAEIKRFTTYEKKYFADALRRSGKYIPFIQKELKKAGLPEELAWLPLIESGFKVKALSTADALGLWQFMPVTGDRFELKRNLYMDERLDPFKSTKAAVRYFRILHNAFGDWETVLAAYNCGEGRVLRTIKRQKLDYSDNFWDLYNHLPRETARFVPRFLATLHIVNNLKKYGFDQIIPEPPLLYETVKISKQLSLKSISKATNIPYPLLKELNPELKHNILPLKPYELRVPTGVAAKLLSKINTTPESGKLAVHRSVRHYKIKSGDSLWVIAKKFGTTVSQIKNFNQLSTAKLKIGLILKIPS
ncbi:MAG: transglycosylase SLT domain-containing protein [Desulfobacteraceae bacterium]|nr:transglycosylase SLT domain-containing protein [Desulfobacteraceae bacterium]